MILYFSPGACSLADHIALHEAGLDFQHVKVDLKAHRTEDGRDYMAVNPKGYVPALQFDDGAILTENVAILSWIADKAPALAPGAAKDRYRLLEALTFVSTEVHKQFKPIFDPTASADAKAKANEVINKRLTFIGDRLEGDYVFGDEASVVDAYLFVMAVWAQRTGVPVPPSIAAFAERMRARPAVSKALEHEGLK